MDHSDMAGPSEQAPQMTLSVRMPDMRHNESPAPSLTKPALVAMCIPLSKWVPDDVALNCMAPECQQPFTLFTRKHHCRVCGRIFCANCSSRVVKSEKEGNVRVCNSCFFEHQLVISRLRHVGSTRNRGELKLLPRTFFVQLFSFLTMSDLAVVACVSPDFYFASRDNSLWFFYNAVKWAGRKDSALRTMQPSQSRYQYTQFLDYVARLERSKCEGLNSFAVAAKRVLSSRIKITVIGPSGVGKTSIVKRFVGDIGTGMVGHRHSTVGFVAYNKPVSLVGGVGTDTTLEIYDVAGAQRYSALRAFCCRNSHCIILCYDVDSKVTLVEAASMMEEIEGDLTSQPVVLCGISLFGDFRRQEVGPKDAEGASFRCHRSLQVTPSSSAEAFQAAIQATLDKMLYVSSVHTTQPTIVPDVTVLDILLDCR